MHTMIGTLGAKAFLTGATLMMIGSGTALAADAKHDLPYFASIGAARARMRTGPARTYPASWLYQRAELPVRVIATYKEWRKIEDPDGTQGWMEGRLLRDARTAIVRGPQAVDMREHPSTTSRLLWRAAPGVVGRIGQCNGGWCRLDVKGQAGFVQTDKVWGIGPSESLP